MSIRVMLVEDQAMVRGALAALLALEPDIEVVGQYASAEDALAEAADADVALLDIELPGMTGIEAIPHLRDKWPELKFMLLTTFGRPGYLRAALDAGAAGFLVKDAPASELAQAIRTVQSGGRVIDPELALAALSHGPNPLTPRQRDVLRLARLGRSTATIADELHLTEGTVRNYLSDAISALSAANRADAIRIAEERGWL